MEEARDRHAASKAPSSAAGQLAAPATAVGISTTQTEATRSGSGLPTAPAKAPWSRIPANTLGDSLSPLVGPSFAQVVLQVVQPSSLPLVAHALALTDSREPTTFFTTDEV